MKMKRVGVGVMFILNKFFKKSIMIYLLSFFLPALIILISYKKIGIAPFGDKALLNMDLWGQYFPIYVEKYNKIKEASSLMFSWNGGLGFNLFLQNSYYGNSLLNNILLLFKRDNLVLVFDYIILLKFSLSSLAFCVFLKNKYNRTDLFIVACSTVYSLCGYMLAFITQPMWIDLVILLPLVLLGMERLIFKKKPLLYCLTLALSIYSNFYISFSVCIFLVLYFIVFILSNLDTIKINQIKKTVLDFIVFSLISGCLVAFIVIPIYKGLGLTIAAEIDKPDKLLWYNSLIEYFFKLLPFTKPSLAYEIPNIYTSLFIFIALPLFLFNKKINVIKKCSYIGLIMFLYISMNLNLLNYVWHGFHLPNQLPGRWTFMFSFFIVLIYYEIIINIKGIKLSGILFSIYNIIFILSMNNHIPEVYRLKEENIKFTLVFLFAYVLFMVLNILFKKKLLRNLFTVLISILIIIEVCVNSISVLKEIKLADIKSYNHANEIMEEAISKYEDKDNLYRMEMYTGWTFNPGQLYNYKGLSYYSSTMNGASYNFFQKLGYRVYAKNVSTLYNPYSPIMNSFFSIKYIIDKTKKFEMIGMKEISEEEKYKVFENEFYLPIAFMVNSGMIYWDINSGENFINMHNSLLNSAIGREINAYESLKVSSIEANNVNLSDDKNWENQYYNRVDNNIPVQINFKYDILKDDYLYLNHGFLKGDLKVFINDVEQKIDTPTEKVKMIGKVKTGDVVNVKFESTDVQLGLWGMDLFTVNTDKLSECYRELNQKSAEVIKFEDTKIDLKVNSESENQILYTSIPDDGGWKVKSNGKNLNTFKIGEYLLAVKVPKGESVINFEYEVPGLRLGILVSVISLIVLIILVYKKQRCSC